MNAPFPKDLFGNDTMVRDAIFSGAERLELIRRWGKTKSGAPTHPMARGKHRIPRDQKPMLWRPAG